MPYTTILGTPGSVSFEKYIEKRYLRSNARISGYYTGLTLANMYGFTTQNPACLEIKSNEATTTQRNISINGRNLILYKPNVKITEENVSELQFLDLMSSIDKFSELRHSEYTARLQDYVEKTRVDFSEVKKYLSFYPCKVYKNLYEGGLMRELV